MSTRLIEFFMCPDEFVTHMSRICSHYQLDSLAVANGVISPVDLASTRDVASHHTIYIAPHGSPWPVEADVIGAELGWVESNPPKIQGDVLFKANVGSKSDWFDTSTGQQMENLWSHRLFEKIRKEIKKTLHFPTWAYDRQSGAGRAYPSLGYSDGARQWAGSGGHLMQYGVKNVVYDTKDRSKSSA